MNLRDLKYLVAVAEHRHFGRAAEACFVSQPTLSTQLKKLEETLGVTLIERSNRQVMLVAEGEKIVEQAQRILAEVNILTAMSEQIREPMGGELRLGVIPTIAPYLLPKILGPISKDYFWYASDILIDVIILYLVKTRLFINESVFIKVTIIINNFINKRFFYFLIRN